MEERYDQFLEGIGPLGKKKARKPKWKSGQRSRSAENQAQSTLKLAAPRRTSSAGGLIVDGPLGPGDARASERRQPLAEPERRANAQRLFEMLSRQANF